MQYQREQLVSCWTHFRYSYWGNCYLASLLPVGPWHIPLELIIIFLKNSFVLWWCEFQVSIDIPFAFLPIPVQAPPKHHKTATPPPPTPMHPPPGNEKVYEYIFRFPVKKKTRASWSHAMKHTEIVRFQFQMMQQYIDFTVPWWVDHEYFGTSFDVVSFSCFRSHLLCSFHFNN